MSTTAIVFVALLMASLVMAFIRHPSWGLYGYLLTFYINPAGTWWGAELPELRWSLIVAGLTLLAALVNSTKQQGLRPWYDTPFIKVFIAFTAFMWIQLPWALRFDDQLFLATLFTKYVVMFVLIYTTLTDANKIRTFLLAHVVGCFYWSWLAYESPGVGRLETIGTSDLSGSAFASMQVSCALAVAGFLMLSSTWRLKPILLGMIPFLLNAIVLMATRGAFVALVLTVPVALFFTHRSRRWLMISSGVLGVVLLSLLSNEYFWDRMGTVLTPRGQQMESSAASRLDIAEANVRMFKDHPFGVGHRGNDQLSPLYLPEYLLSENETGSVRSAHNTEFAVLVDHGIVGITLFLAFHLQILLSLLRLRRIKDPDYPLQLRLIVAALATSYVLYWGSSQFANFTKAEVVIWIAAITAVMEAQYARARALRENESRVHATLEAVHTPSVPPPVAARRPTAGLTGTLGRSRPPRIG